MMSRTDEPLEGVAFQCAGPCPADRYQRIGAHGEMISSDLHGAEEPIRWTLGWQRQDSFVTSPCTHREEEGRPHQDVFGIDHSLWGSAPYRWDVDIVDQDATRAGWTTSRARGSHVGLV
jgi:hypothetical protein